MHTRLTFVLLFFCAFIPVLTHAEIYKWVDEQGRTHYGDKPHANSESVNVKSSPEQSNINVPADRLEKQKRFLRAREIERAQKRQADEKEKREAALRQRNCARAKHELQRQTTATGLYRLNEKGERVFLSFEERTKAEKQTRAAIKKWCK